MWCTRGEQYGFQNLNCRKADKYLVFPHHLKSQIQFLALAV